VTGPPAAAGPFPADDPGWTWEYEGYDPGEERLREALCTLGNGRFATRGAAPECAADDVHYPGTYGAGCYNRLTSAVDGHHVQNEDMVNLPNWLPLRVRILGEESRGDEAEEELPPQAPWLTPDGGALRGNRQRLRLDRGVLEREVRYEDERGRSLTVRQVRMVHMADPYLAVLRSHITAGNFTGRVEIESALDGSVTNAGVARYRDLNGSHLTDLRTGSAHGGTVWLGCSTTVSGLHIGMAQRTTVHGDGTPRRLRSGTPHEAGRAVQVWRVDIAEGDTVTVDKVVALHTSHDHAIGHPLDAAVDRAGRAPGVDELLRTQHIAWRQLWRRADLDVPGEAGRTLRLHLFHLLGTLSPHTADLDVGVPARGLHGEAYRGHVFWDELFVLPYLNLHFPEVSRALLGYRYRRLERARTAARDAGFDGAMYPWQSGSDGREETQELHLNPRSGRWLPDHSRRQRHVGSAIAYNVWQYGEATGDTAFLHTGGAEMLVQIARFWASASEWDAALGRHRIRGVVGPDEYHDGYPDAAEAGLDDNAYTNVTAAWVLARTLDLLDAMPAPERRDLAERTGFDDAELTRWDHVSRTLHVPFHSGVISQFDGYGDLAELDWEGYTERYGTIRRLDRILEAEGDTVNRYRASKQADVLMLGYLFSTAELTDLFGRLGYRFDDALWQRTVDYYLRRTSHGSTLSGLVHGWVLARARRADAWTFFQEAVQGDIADLQGGTTGEGIHLGAMAGTLDMVQRGLTGLATRCGALCLDPVPMPELAEYRFSVHYQGRRGLNVCMRPGQLHVTVPDTGSGQPDGAVRVRLPDRALTVEPGGSADLPVRD
jgi:trehalose/maltose hydrolase-like predicted phosphorylase